MCRKHGISDATFYKWRSKYGGMEVSEAKRAQPVRANATKSNRATTPAKAHANSKQAVLIERLRRKQGATIAEPMQATGWQAHSVRGAISGTLKKKLGLDVTSEKIEGRGRVYRIA